MLLTSIKAAIPWFCCSFRLTCCTVERGNLLPSENSISTYIGKGQALSHKTTRKMTFPRKTNTASLSYLTTQPLSGELIGSQRDQRLKPAPPHPCRKASWSVGERGGKGHSLKPEKIVFWNTTVGSPGKLLSPKICCKNYSDVCIGGRTWHWEIQEQAIFGD